VWLEHQTQPERDISTSSASSGFTVQRLCSLRCIDGRAQVHSQITMAKRLRSNSYLDDQISASTHPPLSESELSTTTKIPPTKITVPSPEPSSEPQTQQLMRCSLPPHKETITFSTYDDYESHYLKTHVNRCSECGKNFPTQHILDIHIEENHDPLILARRDRGEKTVCTIPSHPSLVCLQISNCNNGLTSSAASSKAVTGNAQQPRSGDGI
jgi:hypothetical protein